MRPTAVTTTTILIILILPVLCLGSVSSGPDLVPPMGRADDGVSFRLDVERNTGAELPGDWTVDLETTGISERVRSLRQVRGGTPCPGKPAPDDMISMMSFLWGRMFGGVDIVAEVKDFARRWKDRGNYVRVSRPSRPDHRHQWKLVIACRIDDRTELAARVKAKGSLFGEGKLALEVNALDPMSEELGVTMSYDGADVDIRADRMTLTETAEARLVVKFW